MALETEVSMMATEDVLETFSAGLTIVSSLVFIIILKTIAVRGRHQSPLLLPVEAGEPGGPGAPAASPVVVASGVETDTAVVLAVLTPRPLRPGYVTHSPAHHRDTNTRGLTSSNQDNSMDRDNLNMVDIPVKIHTDSLSMDILVKISMDNTKLDNLNMVKIIMDSTKLDNLNMDTLSMVDILVKIYMDITKLDNLSKDILVNIRMDNIKLVNLNMDTLNMDNIKLVKISMDNTRVDNLNMVDTLVKIIMDSTSLDNLNMDTLIMVDILVKINMDNIKLVNLNMDNIMLDRTIMDNTTSKIINW